MGIQDTANQCKKVAIALFLMSGKEVLGTELVNHSSSDIDLIRGLKSVQIESCLGGEHYDEIIHRNNLVLKAYNN